MGAAWFAACVTQLSAQPGSPRPPDLAQIGKPDAAAARILLERFRSSGPAGD